ncbi:MAG: DMT family transporter [Chthoniobacteraceae bacterium]
MMGTPAVGIAAALGSAFSWALGAILFKRIGERMSPLAMTLAKAAVSVVFLGIALAFLGFKAINLHDLGCLAGSGLVGIALGDTLFFAALQHLGPQTLVVLMMAGQVLTALLALIFLGERPSAKAWAGIACVIVGVTIVLWANLFGERQRSRSRLRGIVLGLLSIVCMAVSLIMAKEGLDHSSAVSETMQQTMQGTCVRMLAGAVGLALFGLFTGKLRAWFEEGRDARLAGSFLFAVCVVTFGGFWLSLLAIRHVDVAIANTLNSMEPVFVLPLAAIFLKEKITLLQVIGTLTALAGVVVLCNA